MTDDVARQDVAARLRRLADRLATDDLPAARWADLSAVLAQTEGLLPDPPPAETRFSRAHWDATEGTPNRDDPSSVHPLATATSGVYPPLHLDFTDTGLVARIRFGPAWEGPPGLVHGGFLAACFDIVLSALAHRRLGTSVTRSLRVRYLKPTFLESSLRFEVEADPEPVGRLLDLRATLFSEDRVTMRASAQFATLDPARFADRRGTLTLGGVPTDP